MAAAVRIGSHAYQSLNAGTGTGQHESMLEAGYVVDLQYANNDVAFRYQLRT